MVVLLVDGAVGFTAAPTTVASSAVTAAERPLEPLDEERLLLDDFLIFEEDVFVPSFHAGLDLSFLFDDDVVGTTTFLLPLLP